MDGTTTVRRERDELGPLQRLRYLRAAGWVRWVVWAQVLVTVLGGMVPPTDAVVRAGAPGGLLPFALLGALTWAFEHQRRWSWGSVLVVQIGVVVLQAATGHGWVAALGLLASALLLHPDAREWGRPGP